MEEAAALDETTAELVATLDAIAELVAVELAIKDELAELKLAASSDEVSVVSEDTCDAAELDAGLPLKTSGSPPQADRVRSSMPAIQPAKGNLLVPIRCLAQNV